MKKITGGLSDLIVIDKAIRTNIPKRTIAKQDNQKTDVSIKKVNVPVQKVGVLKKTENGADLKKCEKNQKIILKMVF